MTPRFLLDTHILLRWVKGGNRLSREQRRIVSAAVAHRQPLAFSAVSLLEISALEESGRIEGDMRAIFNVLQSEPVFELLPITYEIAEESALLHSLRDPGDRTIVATARVHRLKLITSDQKIAASKLVGVVE